MCVRRAERLRRERQRQRQQLLRESRALWCLCACVGPEPAPRPSRGARAQGLASPQRPLRPRARAAPAGPPPPPAPRSRPEPLRRAALAGGSLPEWGDPDVGGSAGLGTAVLPQPTTGHPAPASHGVGPTLPGGLVCTPKQASSCTPLSGFARVSQYFLNFVFFFFCQTQSTVLNFPDTKALFQGINAGPLGFATGCSQEMFGRAQLELASSLKPSSPHPHPHTLAVFWDLVWITVRIKRIFVIAIFHSITPLSAYTYLL